MRRFRVIKDLAVDMEAFLANCRAVKACPISDEMLPGTERLQTPELRDRFDAAARCILCGACITGCSTFWANANFLGPAAIVAAHRFIFDSRDHGVTDRLEILNERSGIWRAAPPSTAPKSAPEGSR